MLTMMAGLADLKKTLSVNVERLVLNVLKLKGTYGKTCKSFFKGCTYAYLTGKTRLQIQEELGISRATYYNLLNKLLNSYMDVTDIWLFCKGVT